MTYPQGCSEKDVLDIGSLNFFEERLEVHNPNLFRPPEIDTNYFYYTKVLTDYGSSQLNR